MSQAQLFKALKLEPREAYRLAERLRIRMAKDELKPTGFNTIWMLQSALDTWLRVCDEDDRKRAQQHAEQQAQAA